MGRGLVLGLALLTGCAGAEGTHHRHHHRPIEGDDDPAPPPVKVEPWSDFGLLPSLHVVGEPRVSSHRLGNESATVRVNGAAEGYGRGAPLEAGALLVESLAPTADAAPTAHFVMVKRAPGYFPAGGDFEYLVVDPTGGVLARGELPTCARCHAEAPHDFVFGPALRAP